MKHVITEYTGLTVLTDFWLSVYMGRQRSRLRMSVRFKNRVCRMTFQEVITYPVFCCDLADLKEKQSAISYLSAQCVAQFQREINFQERLL